MMASLHCDSFSAAQPPDERDWENLAPHPRLFANEARFAAIKKQNDTVSVQLRELVAARANRALGAAPVEYPPVGFLFAPAREVQGRILALALHYRLTGDTRCRERAREELLRLAALPEWRPSHFLDVGEAALAAGVGFDWLHDDLTPAEREIVAAAIVRNAIKPSFEAQPGAGSWVNGDFNWTQVCHGGVVVGALAIAEREPALARQVVERAIKNFGNVGAAYAPDGSHAEGPGYWSYGTTFHVILIEALRTALGTSCGLERFPGFLKTADYFHQMTTPARVPYPYSDYDNHIGGDAYNYSDHHEENLNEPVMLWFARERRDLDVAREELASVALRHARVSDGNQSSWSRHIPLELLWWEPSLPDAAVARSRHWTAAGVLPLAVMRSAWDDPNASYVAIKGGTPNHSHGHMDVGSFILEAGGVRWALDLGAENYSKMRAAKLDLWNYSQDSSRWTTFRVGPEAHNILRFDGARQNTAGKAVIRRLPDAPDGTMGDVVELTPLYAGQVARVTRTVKLHADRSITIADEWTAGGRAVNASFQWLTRAAVTRTAGGLLLTQAGRVLALDITAPESAVIVVEDVSASRAPQDSDNPGLQRIVISVPTTARETVRLHVKATLR